MGYMDDHYYTIFWNSMILWGVTIQGQSSID